MFASLSHAKVEKGASEEKLQFRVSSLPLRVRQKYLKWQRRAVARAEEAALSTEEVAAKARIEKDSVKDEEDNCANGRIFRSIASAHR